MNTQTYIYQPFNEFLFSRGGNGESSHQKVQLHYTLLCIITLDVVFTHTSSGGDSIMNY